MDTLGNVEPCLEKKKPPSWQSPTTRQHANTAFNAGRREWDEMSSEPSISETSEYRVAWSRKHSMETPERNSTVSSPSFAHLLRPIKLDMPCLHLNHLAVSSSLHDAHQMPCMHQGKSFPYHSSRTPHVSPSHVLHPLQSKRQPSTEGYQEFCRFSKLVSNQTAHSKTHDDVPSHESSSKSLSHPDSFHNHRSRCHSQRRSPASQGNIPLSQISPSLDNVHRRSKPHQETTKRHKEKKKVNVPPSPNVFCPTPLREFPTVNRVTKSPCSPRRLRSDDFPHLTSRPRSYKISQLSCTSSEALYGTPPLGENEEKSIQQSRFDKHPSLSDALVSDFFWDGVAVSGKGIAQRHGLAYLSHGNVQTNEASHHNLWVPYDFCCVTIRTPRGCLGVNYANECFYTYSSDDGTSSSSSRLMKHRKHERNKDTHLLQSHAIYNFFVVALRGKGPIRIEKCQVDQQQNVVSRISVEKWENYEQLPLDYRRRFHHGRWLFECLKATTIRVQLTSSQGWKARRVVESLTLPSVLFPHQPHHRDLSSLKPPRWCFYIILPWAFLEKEWEIDKLLISCPTLMILMRSDGSGSVYTSQGDILWTFNGTTTSDRGSVLCDFPSRDISAEESVMPQSFRTKIETLTKQLYVLCYVLEMNAEAVMYQQLLFDISSIRVHSAADFSKIINFTLKKMVESCLKNHSRVSIHKWPISYTLCVTVVTVQGSCLGSLPSPSSILSTAHQLALMDSLYTTLCTVLQEPTQNALVRLKKMIHVLGKNGYDGEGIFEHLNSEEEVVVHAASSMMIDHPTVEMFLAHYKRELVILTNENHEDSDAPSKDSLMADSLSLVFSKTQQTCLAPPWTQDIILATLLYVWLLFIEEKKGEKKQSQQLQDNVTFINEPADLSLGQTSKEKPFTVSPQFPSHQLLPLLHSILENILKRASYFLCLVSRGLSSQQFHDPSLYAIALKCWGTSLCCLERFLLIHTNSCREASQDTPSLTALSKVSCKTYRRGLNLACDILRCLSRSTKDLLCNSSLLLEFSNLVCCNGIPKGMLRSSCQLKETLDFFIFSYQGERPTHLVFMFLGCYLTIIESQTCKHYQTLNYMKTVSQEKFLWHSFTDKTLEILNQESEMLFYLTHEHPIQDHHRHSVLHMERLLLFASYMIRYSSGHPLSIFPQYKAYWVHCLCYNFPLKHFLDILNPLFNHIVKSAKESFEARLEFILDGSHDLREDRQSKEKLYTFKRKHAVLVLKEGVLVGALTTLFSLLECLPPHILMLYTHPLLSTFNTFLYAEDPSFFRESSAKVHQMSPSLRTWALQCRYSSYWCTLLKLFLQRISCAVDDPATLSFLVSCLRCNVECLSNPLVCLPQMLRKHWEKEMLQNPSLKNASQTPSFSQLDDPLLVNFFLDFFCDDGTTSTESLCSSNPDTRRWTQLLVVTLHMFSMAQTLYETFGPQRFPLEPRVALDELALRLLWKQSDCQTVQVCHPSQQWNLWKFSLLDEHQNDRRLLLTKQIISFLHVSFTAGPLSPSLISVAMGVLRKVQHSVSMFHSSTHLTSSNLQHQLTQDIETLLKHLRSSFIPPSSAVDSSIETAPHTTQQQIQHYEALFAACQAAGVEDKKTPPSSHAVMTSPDDYQKEPFPIHHETLGSACHGSKPNAQEKTHQDLYHSTLQNDMSGNEFPITYPPDTKLRNPHMMHSPELNSTTLSDIDYSEKDSSLHTSILQEKLPGELPPQEFASSYHAQTPIDSPNVTSQEPQKHQQLPFFNKITKLSCHSSTMDSEEVEEEEEEEEFNMKSFMTPQNPYSDASVSIVTQPTPHNTIRVETAKPDHLQNDLPEHLVLKTFSKDMDPLWQANQKTPLTDPPQHEMTVWPQQDISVDQVGFSNDTFNVSEPHETCQTLKDLDVASLVPETHHEMSMPLSLSDMPKKASSQENEAEEFLTALGL